MGLISSIKKSAVSMAGGYAKDYLTMDNITKWILDAVNALLAKAMQKVDDKKLAEVCATCDKVSTLCSILSKALADKTITEEEANSILKSIQDIIGSSGISNEKIGALIDKAVEQIKAKM